MTIDQALPSDRDLLTEIVAGDRGAVLGHLRFERGEPVAVGAAFVGKQAVSRAHRRVVARGVVGVARGERQREAVEEAATLARGGDEEAVHRGGEPQDREPLG